MAERNGVAATFAAIARNVEKNPELAEYLRDCVASGHEIASHSYSHGAGVWNRSGPASEGFADAMEKDLDKADAVCICGDIQSRAMHTFAWINSLKKPVVLVPGNHDWFLYDPAGAASNWGFKPHVRVLIDSGWT